MDAVELENRYSARNYRPLPVTLARGEGAYLWDTDGRRYIDMMSAYSAVSHGHGHPRILAVLDSAGAAPRRAVARLSQRPARAVPREALRGHRPRCRVADEHRRRGGRDRDQGGAALGLSGESASRAIAPRSSSPRGNFHGRTTTIIGFSSEPEYRDGFGPFAPGFRAVPFGDLAAMEAAITPDTAAVLIEPIQGEAGIIVPPAGYLAGVRALCDAKRRAADRRRGAVGPRPHRRVVRLSA